MLPFPVTKLGKGKKKKGGGGGFLACCVHSEIELSHSLHSGHRVGSLSKQHDWWWCWTCRDILANAHTNTHTCTTQESWKRGTPILSLRWHFIFKHTQKLSSLSHMSSIPESQQCTSNRSPPGREHSSWWKSSRLKRHSPLPKLETVCLSAPPPRPNPRYMERLWHSPATAALQKNVYVGMSFHKKLIKLSGTFFWSVYELPAMEENRWEKKKKKKSEHSTEQSHKYKWLVLLFSQNCPA